MIKDLRMSLEQRQLPLDHVRIYTLRVSICIDVLFYL